MNSGKRVDGSYGFNGWNHFDMYNENHANWYKTYQTPEEGQPDMAPILADSIWVDGWPMRITPLQPHTKEAITQAWPAFVVTDIKAEY